MSQFTVIKRDAQGSFELSYSGELVARSDTVICIRAQFGFPSRDYGYVHLKTGDTFIEWFYADRWYNVFRIHDRDDGGLKGYYCNFTRPAIIGAASVAADDLALDLFVHPTGRMQLLDEDDYRALTLPAAERRAVQRALVELRHLVQQRAAPFADLPPATP